MKRRKRNRGKHAVSALPQIDAVASRLAALFSDADPLEAAMALRRAAALVEANDRGSDMPGRCLEGGILEPCRVLLDAGEWSP